MRRPSTAQRLPLRDALPMRLQQTRLSWLCSLLLLLALLLQLHVSPAAGSRKPFRVTRTVTTVTTSADDSDPPPFFDPSPSDDIAAELDLSATVDIAAPHPSLVVSTAFDDSDSDEADDMLQQQQQRSHPVKSLHTSISAPPPSAPQPTSTANLSTTSTPDLLDVPSSLPSSSSSSSSWSSYVYPVLALGGLLSLSSLAYMYYRYRTSPRPLPPAEQFHHRTLLAQLATPRGRLQSLDWAVQALRWDEDGDCAHAFLGPFVLREDRERRERQERTAEEAGVATAAGEEVGGLLGKDASEELKGANGRGMRRRKR